MLIGRFIMNRLANLQAPIAVDGDHLHLHGLVRTLDKTKKATEQVMKSAIKRLRNR